MRPIMVIAVSIFITLMDTDLCFSGVVVGGPSIEIVSPYGSQPVASPFALQIKFITKSNRRIDIGRTKLTYLKSPIVDLTDRIVPYLSESGLYNICVEAPPGTHKLRIEVRDTEGFIGTKIFSLTVVPELRTPTSDTNCRGSTGLVILIRDNETGLPEPPELGLRTR